MRGAMFEIFKCVTRYVIVNESRHQVSTDSTAVDEMNACHTYLVEICGRLDIFIYGCSRMWRR